MVLWNSAPNHIIRCQSSKRSLPAIPIITKSLSLPVFALQEDTLLHAFHYSNASSLMALNIFRHREGFNI